MASRRRFLKVAAQGMAGVACASSSSACADGEEAPPLESDVVLLLADYPDLQDVGGMVELESALTRYAYPIFVRNEGGDDFVALAGFCNHRSCAVMTASDGFECPCHGARFDADGILRDGPATADLIRFETDLDGETLTIRAS